jgi:hypothetical protein
MKRVDNETAVVATHYYNPDDDREIKGVADPAKIDQYYQNLAEE